MIFFIFFDLVVKTAGTSYKYVKTAMEYGFHIPISQRPGGSL